ncbi:uncharacterized protein LOC144169784 [Haemaphysalis longicornis]
MAADIESRHSQPGSSQDTLGSEASVPGCSRSKESSAGAAAAASDGGEAASRDLAKGMSRSRLLLRCMVSVAFVLAIAGLLFSSTYLAHMLREGRNRQAAAEAAAAPLHLPPAAGPYLAPAPVSMRESEPWERRHRRSRKRLSEGRLENTDAAGSQQLDDQDANDVEGADGAEADDGAGSKTLRDSAQVEPWS